MPGWCRRSSGLAQPAAACAALRCQTAAETAGLGAVVPWAA
jgi:hypothetical protein